jgi:bifunctional oligoribonuclease and PAP phosphatase NrnA
MHPIQDAFPLLEHPRKIFITTHHKPDGDAIGSMLGLHHYLAKLGHQVTSVSPSELPDFLMWMPGVELLLNYESEPKDAQKALQECDLIFCVDFNDYSRTKHLTELLAAATQPKILIDHHLMPAPTWDYGMSIPEKSSTCEMVYDFIKMHNDVSMLDRDIAACLYTGVLTDTGSFRFPVTSAAVHEMIAQLKRTGLEHSIIHERIYDSWSAERMRFLGYILSEKMEIFPDIKTGLIGISKKDMAKFDVQSGDMEGMVNQPLSIEGIVFSVLVIERNDEVKLSLRSKGNFDVSAIARQYFSGGGHFNASGGRSNLSFHETIAYFKKILSDIHPR